MDFIVMILAGLLFVFLSKFVVGTFKKDFPALPSHEHIWKAVSAKTHTEHAHKGSYGFRKTRILQTCFCGETNVKVIEGHWTLEEVTSV